MMTTDDSDREADERITQLLRELQPDSVIDDLQFEHLARRISASATQEIRSFSQTAQIRHATWWRGGLVSAGLAAAAVFVLMFIHAGNVGQTNASQRALTGGTEPWAVADTRVDLFAASVGAVSEHDFIANLWDEMDAEALLSRSERQ